MRLYLIRHAHAGQRLPGGHDRYRPLSPDGHARAAALVDLFEDVVIDGLVSSPATRCLQTLEGLSMTRGLPIEERASLGEGADTLQTLAELAPLEAERDRRLVACSHGDVIPAVLEQLSAAGVPLAGRGCELGSVWVVDHDGSSWTGARYVNPRAAGLPAG